MMDDALALGALLRTLVFKKSWLGVSKGKPPAGPLKFCSLPVHAGSRSRVSPFLKCFLSG